MIIVDEIPLEKLREKEILIWKDPNNAGVIAQFSMYPGVVGKGRSLEEAIGTLLFSQPDVTGITVRWAYPATTGACKPSGRGND